MKAINTYVIVILTYTYIITAWSPTGLESLERIIRTKIPKRCMYRKTLVLKGFYYRKTTAV